MSMSDNKIKVGFVGLSATDGWAASAIAPALLNPTLRGAYDLVAVSTTSETTAQAAADKYSKDIGHHIKAYFGDVSKIAADPDVDMVAVAVKAMYHKKTVMPIIEAKKDFFIEWPAGTSTQETEEIAAAAKKHGVKSLVGLQGRHAVSITKVKELLDSGVIGTVRSSNIHAHVPRETGSWAPVVEEKSEYVVDKKNGVTLLSIAVAHQLDTVTHLLGEFASLTATEGTIFPTVTIIDNKTRQPTGRTHPSQSSDHIAITGFLKTGVLLNIFWRAGYSATGRRQFIWQIDGDEGTISLQSDHILGALSSIIEPELHLNGEKVEFEIPGNASLSYVESWKKFAGDGSATYATIEDAVKHHRLIDAIEESAKEGKWVTF